VNDDRSLLGLVAMGHETWFSSMIPKQNDKAWNGACQVLRDTKDFDFKIQKQSDVGPQSLTTGIIHKEFVPPGHVVNKGYYVEVFSRLVQRIHRVRPQFQERGSWFLLHDNGRRHTAVSMK
jgi:hypothetical protein